MPTPPFNVTDALIKQLDKAADEQVFGPTRGLLREAAATLLRQAATRLQITKILIVRQRYGTDGVMLETTLPGTVFPFTELLTLHFEAARGHGPDYVAKHFPGIPTELAEYK